MAESEKEGFCRGRSDYSKSCPVFVCVPDACRSHLPVAIGPKSQEFSEIDDKIQIFKYALVTKF